MLRISFLWTGLLACLALPVSASPVNMSQSLNTYMQRVWEQHPNINAAQAALDAARQRAEAAGQPLYNPELELEAEKTDINTFSVGISQTIDWGGKRGAQQQIGNAEIQLSKADLAITKQQVSAEVLTALVHYQTAQRHLQLAQHRAELTERLTETIEQRFSAGDIGQLDVALARVAHSQSRMQLATHKAETVKLYGELLSVSGLEQEHWPSLLEVPLKPQKNPVRDELLSQLPHLIAQQSRVQIAKSATGLAKANRSTEPTLGLRGGREDTENLIGLSLSFPLMVRNNFSAEVKAASADVIQQEQTLMDIHRRVSARFDGSLERFRLIHAAWQTWKDGDAALLTQQMDLLQHIWKAGEINTSEFLLQAGQNVDAQEAATDLVGDMWLAWIDWLDASGQINDWIKNTDLHQI